MKRQAGQQPPFVFDLRTVPLRRKTARRLRFGVRLFRIKVLPASLEERFKNDTVKTPVYYDKNFSFPENFKTHASLVKFLPGKQINSPDTMAEGLQ